MGSKGPTLHEVADRAGVSIATVSRVARGVSQVSPSTTSRVRNAIRELNYRPSHLGRALVNRTHGTLGIVFPGLRGPYYSEVIHGFEIEAVKQELCVLILGTELLASAREQVLGMADRSDGLAIMGGTIDDDLVQDLAGRGIPLVTMARDPLPGISNIAVDNAGSTVALTRHLIRDHGYTRLGFVGGISGAPDSAIRWRAFIDTHAACGLPAPAAPLFAGMEESAGVQAALHIFSSPDRPQALVCSNDELALGVLNIAHARGINVPADMAVTGWDDIPFASVSIPPLTTVRQPARQLGTSTAQILVDQISGRQPGPLHQQLPTRLIIRGSCGCHMDTDMVRSAPGSHPVPVPALRKEAASEP